MRVLHILNELRPSGAETMLRAAAAHWRRQGIAGEILCTGAEQGSYAAALAEAGYRIHHLPFNRSAGFLWALWRFFRKRQFDAVQVHTERAAFWYAALAFASGQGPLVRSIHAVFAFQGGLRLRRAAQRWGMREAFGVRMVACSESVRRTEFERFGNPAEVIPNWFDGAVYRPAEPGEREAARAHWGLAGGDFVVATAGNCGPVKNHGSVLEALAALRGQRQITWLHAGEEEPGCPERARALALGASGQVRFLGTVTGLREVFHAADLFLMPSLREGFGIAAVEAMAAGVPVALAEVEGLRDFRALGGPIYWMTPDAAGVAAAVRHFAAMGAGTRRQAGEELSERAHRRYGGAAGAERYAALYRGGGAAPDPYPAGEGAR